MQIPAKILKFLDSKKIKYVVINHRTVYTAYDKATTLKVKPNVIGKTLVLKIDSNLIMVLVPGNKNLDLSKIKKAVGVQKINIVSETIIKNKFKGIKIGAIPPAAEIWKLRIFIDNNLMKEKNIFVNSGIYEASFKLSPKVFEKLGAVVGNFGKPR
ncbi:MAG: YbaK/EbsC family protein [Candidatus Pacebacteria bacterium]|nr:YbaK/EbsC family protein [Candidatus Paceibacterota bacterium]